MLSKITIFYNPRKQEAAIKAKRLEVALKTLGAKANIYETKSNSQDWGLLDKDTNLVIALGGDGTLLLVSKQVFKHNIPLLGVNFGHLGFLSEYGDIEMEDLANEVYENQIHVEDRSLLKAEIKVNDIELHALNDIVVNRSLGSNLLYTDLLIDNNLLHSFRSDGIIVCTPTGSTAYALSAGGAVMDPHIKAFQIVPIAAHSLNSRPHVVSDEQEIVLVSKDTDNHFYIQADGQELIEIKPGSRIVLKKSPYSLKLAKLKSRNRNFYSILRDKMKWGSVVN